MSHSHPPERLDEKLSSSGRRVVSIQVLPLTIVPRNIGSSYVSQVGEDVMSSYAKLHPGDPQTDEACNARP